MNASAEVVQRLTDAFNKRDQQAFLALLSEDVEFRNPMGNSTRGLDAAKEFWTANEQMGVFVEHDGPERVDGARVAVPTIMRVADGTELRSAAVFEVRRGRVELFWVVMDRSAAGL